MSGLNELRRRALGRLALSEADVVRFYALPVYPAAELHKALRRLCESHERLRAELAGAEAVLNEPESETLRLRARVAAALALTDTGSPEFLAAFPPRSAGDAAEPRAAVAGWRVVEKIRAALLGDQ